MFDLGSILLQATTVPTNTVVSTGTAMDSIVALIVAIAGIVGTVAALFSSFLTKGEQTESKQALRGAADYLKDLSDNVIQAKEDIATLADVTYKLMPDKAKEIVNRESVRVAELEAKVRAAHEELDRLPKVLDHL
jgi:hypothetical protein